MEQNFSVFSRRGTGDTKPELRAFYEEWGWMNFLSVVAKTKMFDVPNTGLNSVDCAKRSKAFDVLTWASQEKELAIAEYEAYKIK